jgi:hypothetical protein
MRSLRGLLFLALAAQWESAFAQSPFLVKCSVDSEINGGKRKTITAAAERFMQALQSTNPQGAYDMLSTAGRAQVTSEQFRAQAAALVGQVQPRNIAIQRTFFIELTGKAPQRVVCARDLSNRNETSFVAAADFAEQAHVILTGESRNNKLAFTLWLVPEQNTWRVQSYWMNVASLADNDSHRLLQLGRDQHAKSHEFNAALLYAAAMDTAYRGPNFQMGIAQAISEDAAKLKIPPEIQGKPPFSWKSGDVMYKILNVGPIAIAGKTYVVIAHEVPPGQNNDQFESSNRRLLQYFKTRFPEYSTFFAGVVVRAMERGTGKGYGTVEELPSPR